MKDLKIFTNNVEQKAREQIDLLLEQDAFKNCKVRIMPDVHAGAGCVIGFTANLGDKVTPNLIGVDIGCGMTWYNTGLKEIDLEALDKFIRTDIPSGMNVNDKEYICPVDLEDLKCYKELRNKDRYLQRSLCSLGGGNHFIEVDKAENGDLYIVIHSGSRNLGKQVCEIYQDKAIKNCSYEKEMKEEQSKIIQTLKEQGEEFKIQQALVELKAKYAGKSKLPKDLCYVEGKDRENYLHDMKLCQEWASFNRVYMLEKICLFLNIPFRIMQVKETIHNYIDNNNMARKGAIRALENEMVLIPINMRDGCIIGMGKGNEDWNCSAPHGAGRIMSRHEAREKLSLDKYREEMQGIFTTSVCSETIDEAPMVYKPIEEILENVKETINIIEIIKPIYNFKAKE
ncbi:MAG: RtcB family protein [Clostridia bacterium]|nr:RtcB family protein [Clostridia bacterium]